MLSIISRIIMTVTRKRLRSSEEEEHTHCDEDYVPSDEEEEEEEEPSTQKPASRKRGRCATTKRNHQPRKQKAKGGRSNMLLEAIEKGGIVAKGQCATARCQVAHDEFVTARLILDFYNQQRNDQSWKVVLELWPEGESVLNEKKMPILSSPFIKLVKNQWIPELNTHKATTAAKGWACSKTGSYSVYETLCLWFVNKKHPCLMKEVPISLLSTIDTRDWQPSISSYYIPQEDTDINTNTNICHHNQQQYAEEVLQSALPFTDHEDHDDEEEDEDEEEEEMDVIQEGDVVVSSAIGPDTQLLQKYHLLPPQEEDSTSCPFSTLLSAAEVSFASVEPSDIIEQHQNDDEEEEVMMSSEDEEEEEEEPIDLVVEEGEQDQMDRYLEQLKEGELFNFQDVIDQLTADMPLHTGNTPAFDEATWDHFEQQKKQQQQQEHDFCSLSHAPEDLTFETFGLCVQ